MRVWLLDLELGGRTLRLSTQPVVVNGELYEGTLDAVELREAIEGLGTIAGEREASIGLVPDSALTPYAGLRGRGVLRLWSGRGRGRVELDGSILVSDIGGEREALSMTLSADPYTDTASTHEVQARVTTLDESSAPTWGTIEPPRQTTIGAWYPRIFGTPGANFERIADADQANIIRLDAVETTNGHRAERLIICDAVNHAQPLRVDVISVISSETVVGVTFGAADLGPEPEIATDLLGQQVWTIDVSGESNRFRDGEAFYGVILDQQAVAYSAAGTAPVDTLGRMVWQLARESTVAIDDAEWARVAEALPYRIGYVLREPQSPMEVVLDVLRHYPIALYATPRGLGALRWPYDARRADAVARLVEGQSCSRRSGLRSLRQPGEEIGTVAVEYAYSERTERYTRAAFVSRNVTAAVDIPETSADVWVRTTDEADAVDTIEAPYIMDDAGALEAARWRSRRQALGATALDLDVDADIADGLLLGSVVLVDVPSLDVRDQIGIVSARTLTDRSSWPMTIVLLSQVGLARQTEPTGASKTPPTVILDDPQNPPDPQSN